MKLRLNSFIPFSIFISGALIYWTSAYPTVTWWDTGEYSAAAACLGLTSPPGSIIMTFPGWVLSRFSNQNPALLFNLLAGVIGSLAVFFSFVAFKKIIRLAAAIKYKDFTAFESVWLIIGSVIIICSTTIWEYSLMFTPYILTALFTMFILLSVFSWWETAENTGSWKKIFVITLLLGIDFSVHRTNSILIPGIIIVMLIRNFRTFHDYKSYLAALAGIIAGLSLQLLYIPMSLNDPPMNMGETNTLSEWWKFISLEQYGGNFLMDIFVRKGSLWSYQIPYYFKGFAANFFYFNKNTLILGFLPAVIGLMGMIYIFKKNSRLGTALTLFFLITILASIIYFNLPENYFRPIYRHYLPTFTIFFIFIYAGIIYLHNLVSKLNKSLMISVLITILITAISITQFKTNFRIRNGSKNTIAYDHSKNILLSVERDGILFSYWDNTYYPELYIQIGDKFRPDITQCNLSLINLDWYLKQNQRHDKNFPFSGKDIDTKKIFYNNWKTLYSSFPLDPAIKKRYFSLSDTFHLSMPALRPDNSVMLQDLVLFDIFKNNRFKRPVYFVKQGFPQELKNWLAPYLADEGLIFKFVPDSSTMTIQVLERNLQNFDLSCYNNNSVFLDNISLGVGNLYYDIFLKIIKVKLENCDFINASKYLTQMEKTLPPGRLKPEEKVLKEISDSKRILQIHGLACE